MTWSYRSDDAVSLIRLWADSYDTLLPSLDLNDPTVSRLARLAKSGPVLEFGVGTGRVALPLAELGLSVTGVDGSPEMVDRLRKKDPDAQISIVMGDFTELALAARFSLVFVLQNTFEGLGDQVAQQECLNRAKEHLDDRGVFVIEAFAPHGMLRYGRLDTINVDDVTPEGMRLSALQHDPLQQVVKLGHLVVSDERVRYLPAYFRYLWPSELDLMAERAGLRLRDRWGGWNEEAFSAHSLTYVSVYESS